MSQPISSFFSGTQWGHLLQHFDDEAADAKGTLNVSGEFSEQGKTCFQFTILKPGSNQAVIMNLDDVIRATEEALAKCEEGPNAENMKQGIISGLEHIEHRVKELVNKNKLWNTEPHREAMDFYDQADILIEKVNETPESRAKGEIAQIAGKEKIRSAEMERVAALVKENKNLLFELTPYHESFFDLAAGRCSEEMLMTLLRDVIHEIKSLDPLSTTGFKKFLFRNNAPQPSFFKLMMRQNDGNELFDLLLPFLSDTELNGDENKKEQVIAYAYSVVRYEHIFIKRDELLIETLTIATECLQKGILQLGKLSITDKFASLSASPLTSWNSMRQTSSTTLDPKLGSAASASSMRWLATDEKRSVFAKQHRGSRLLFSLANVKELHKILTTGEEGVNHPGEFREGIVRTSGGWTHLYCPGKFLKANMEHFINWFNASLLHCIDHVMNPIIFAAEVYQRFVTIHPFENANGRMARLLMDYVLERFDLPPPLLGTDILDGLFPLDFTRADHDKFINKIIRGIYLSIKVLRYDFDHHTTVA